MILVYFSVYDKKVAAYMQPFAMRTKGEAMRSFMDACTDGKSQFCSHPEDYHLAYCGQFDDATGLFTGPVAPEPIMAALDCVKEKGG